jgi:hypothetical protein
VCSSDLTPGLFISPFIFSYNLLPLFAFLRRPLALIGFVVLSWVAFIVAAWAFNDRAAALLTMFTLGVLVVQQRRRIT